MNDMEREYRQLCRIDENPGVQGLAQLGRNAIDRVTQLESENAYLRAANSDGAALLQKLQAERAAIKGDYDEAAHLARHFIRDDPGITPRGAIIRLGDKCTDLFCRRQSAEQERDQLRAEVAGLRVFAQAIMDHWPYGDVDGGDLQHMAIAHGLIVRKDPAPTEPCDDGCECAGMVTPEEFAAGVECYRFTALLTGRK